MALPKPAAKFETEDETNDGEKTTQVDPRLAEAAKKRAEAQAQEQAAEQKTELAVSKPAAVAVANKMVDPLKGMENAFPVEWDTLRNLQINQGNVIDKDTDKMLGDTIGLDLLSFQNQWVISPSTGTQDKVKSNEEKEHVRYSNDGVTTTKGDDVKEYLARLKAVYPTAKMSERTVICGCVFDSGKLPELKNELVQINLAPTSRSNFNRYRMGQAYNVGKGFIPAEGANRIKITCTLAKNDDKIYTLANFSRYD